MKKYLVLLSAAAIAFSASAIRIISGPYLQNVGTDEATVVWRTDKPSTAWVEIAPDDKTSFYATSRPKTFETDMGRAVIGTLHKVTLRGLKPATNYRYRIFSEEVLNQNHYHVDYGGIAATDVYLKEPLMFTTAASDKTTANFIMINDIHADSLKFADLLKSYDKVANDFVLLNGDMVSFMNNEDQLFGGFINQASKAFASEKQFVMVRGNHESRGALAKDYMKYFPSNTGKPYFTFTDGPIFFVVLDGGEDKPDDDIEYSRTSFADDYRLEQAAWLKDVVNSPEFKAAPFKVAVVHVPPVLDTWHGSLHAKEVIVPILNAAGIDLMLCGHQHVLRYAEAGKEGTDFPVLINSHDTVVEANADSKEMNLTVKNRAGEVLKKYRYTAK